MGTFWEHQSVTTSTSAYIHEWLETPDMQGMSVRKVTRGDAGPTLQLHSY
jgi:hypothetical protein